MTSMLTSVELFAGVGGLALGASRAGFEYGAVIELDQDACDTIRQNQSRKLEPVVKWPLFQADARDFNFNGSVAELYCRNESIGNRVVQRRRFAISGFLGAILTTSLCRETVPKRGLIESSSSAWYCAKPVRTSRAHRGRERYYLDCLPSCRARSAWRCNFLRATRPAIGRNRSPEMRITIQRRFAQTSKRTLLRLWLLHACHRPFRN